MKIVTFKGGLGNQIFQYAFYLYLKNIYKGKIYGFYNSIWLSDHSGLEIGKVFDIELPKATIISNIIVFLVRFLNIFNKKNFFFCNDKFWNINAIYFDGYWQDKKFLLESNNWIKFKDIKIDKNINEVLQKILNTNSISIHVRRGDYLEKRSHTSYANLYELKYYEKAIEKIQKYFNNPSYFIFSDDINWVKKNLIIKNATYVSSPFSKQSHLDIYLMSKCKSNIIANSSFSYWAAFLGLNEKIVIYPSNWFSSGERSPNIFKNNWICI